MNLARLSKVIAFVANLCPCKKSENVSEPDSGGRAMLFTVHVYVCHAGSQVERPLVHLARYPGGIVPNNTLCQPTPLYEFIACLGIFFILWRLRDKLKPSGALFMLYLVLAGAERFIVEFIRLNPRLLFGLSEAQLISIPLMIIGLAGFFFLRSRTPAASTLSE